MFACPVRAGGSEENTWDSLVMLYNDDILNAVNMLFFWSVVGLNIFGLLVTQILGSVFRAVMLTARTASVQPRHPFFNWASFRAGFSGGNGRRLCEAYDG